MSEAGESQHQVLRWYTRTRKVPQLIGKPPGGGSWPGGPYTVTQAVGGGLVLILGARTMTWWGQFGFLGNLAVLAAAAAGTVIGLRFVKSGGRNPLARLLALVTVTSHRAPAYQAGRAIRVHDPVRLRSRVNVLHAAGPALARPRTPAVVSTPAPPQPVPERPRTVVEGLLAQVRTQQEEER